MVTNRFRDDVWEMIPPSLKKVSRPPLELFTLSGMMDLKKFKKKTTNNKTKSD